MKSYINKKIIGNFFISLFCFVGLYSCDYLDVIPDNIPTVDMMFADRASAEKYLFTCYGYLLHYMHVDVEPGIMGSDEFYVQKDAGQNRDNWGLISGAQNTNDPLCHYWGHNIWGSSMYVGIRDCNTFLEKIHMPSDLSDKERKRWIAEVKFLKAYYHFILYRSYGAISLVDDNIDVIENTDKMMLYREPTDSCVSYISRLYLEAAEDLPVFIEKEATELGRVTKSVALAMNAKLLVTAASPLFNGNTDYSDIIDNRGIKLFNDTYDPKKWEIAAEACKAAIEAAEAGKHALYKKHSATNLVLNDILNQQLMLRSITYDKWNEEAIWSQTKTQIVAVQREAMPSLEDDWTINSLVKGEVNPTLDLVERYYSDNGVPINEDKSYDYGNRYKTKKAGADEKWYIKEGEETAILHFDREPRFYAFIGFDRGIWWGNGRTSLNEDLYYIRSRATESAGLRSREKYCSTGYYAKKLIDYLTIVNKTDFTVKGCPLPMLRLADLYLLYAEALNESKATPDGEVYHYIDQVRERAGLLDCLTAWDQHSNNPDKPKSKVGMRNIIKQERLIELAMEGHSIWDVRRWKDGLYYWNKPVRGWNIHGEDIKEFYNPIVIDKRVFATRDYLWPLKELDVVANKKLVQNYGW